MKKFTKIFSILLLAIVCSFSFIACKNNNNKQTSTNLNANNINTQISIDDQSSENSSNTNDSNNLEDVIDEENTQSKIDFINGIYKFENYNLSFANIYYENEAELLSYFKTRDLNGVYDAVYRLGFEDFIKSITLKTIDDKTFNNYIHFTKIELNETTDILKSLVVYEYKTNIFTYFTSAVNYHNNNGEIIPMENNNTITAPNPTQIIINDDGTISLLYQFSYTNSELDELIATPLYVKTNIELYNKFETTNFDENSISYNYLESSAIIESNNGFIDINNAMSKLEEMFNTLEMPYSITEFLSKSELYFSTDKSLYIMFTSVDKNIIITNKTNNANEYSILDAIKFNVTGEYYDLTLNRSVLDIEIQIDENTTFKCNFFTQL